MHFVIVNFYCTCLLEDVCSHFVSQLLINAIIYLVRTWYVLCKARFFSEEVELLHINILDLQ